MISRIIAKRTDDKIMAAVYYIPPQQAITPGESGGNGELGLRGSAPKVICSEPHPSLFLGENTVQWSYFSQILVGY